MRTIMSACLMMFVFLSVCPAGADPDQSVCLAWNDTYSSVCPDYQTKAMLGKRILAIGEAIVANGTRRQGDCWDFVNAVYNCAGYSEKWRTIVFGGAEHKEKGPYLEDMNIIQPGDWIMHHNMEHGGVEHSAIFVFWIDKEKKSAITLDYVGKTQCEAGYYKPHRLTEVYCIYRAIPGKEEAGK